MSEINRIRVNGIDYDIGSGSHNIKPYDIQTIHVDEGDVILLHLSNSLDMDDMNVIHGEVKKMFPKNDILMANEHILQGISIIKKPPVGKISITENFDIKSEYPDLFNWGINV